MSDDDLPVLTQVLRTAAGHLPPPLARLPDGAFAEDFAFAAFDEMTPDGPIIIGNDPAEVEAPAPEAATVDGVPAQDAIVAGGSEIVADPRQPLVGDAFRILPETNGPIAANVPSIDEPELVPATAFGNAPAQGLDTPIVFASADLEALAVRVRDAVLADLSTRIDTELDARIAQAMHVELETALAQLQGSLRSNLTDALRDVVARAVDEQIARISWSGAGPRAD